MFNILHHTSSDYKNLYFDKTAHVYVIPFQENRNVRVMVSSIRLQIDLIPNKLGVLLTIITPLESYDLSLPAPIADFTLIGQERDRMVASERFKDYYQQCERTFFPKELKGESFWEEIALMVYNKIKELE